MSSVTRKCRHGTFLFNRNDTFVGRSLDLYGEWCEAEIELLAQVIKPGDVVLDVGANIGTHAVPFSRMVGDSGCVIAFEPQRLVFQNLCANLALNGLCNVVAHEVGVGREAGRIPVPVLDPRQEFNFAALAISGHASGAMVKIVRIDDLKLTRCNLLKVDVEGMEADVLAGAAATIERFRPVLFVENNTIERSRPLLEMLQSLNYVAWWHIRSYFNPANFRWKLQSKNSPPATAISLGILVRFRRSVCIGRGQTNSSRRVENGGGSGNQTESSDPAEGSLTSAGVGGFSWYRSAGYSRARKKLRFMSRPTRVCSNNWYRNQGAKRFVERRCSGIFSKIHYIHPRFVP